MRKFKCSPFGEEVDLDDPETYSYLPKTVKELDSKMFSEIGFALCYMEYFRPEFYNGSYKDGGQRERILKLIENFTKERLNNYQNIIWRQEQIFIFQDEIENMC